MWLLSQVVNYNNFFSNNSSFFLEFIVASSFLIGLVFHRWSYLTDFFQPYQCNWSTLSNTVVFTESNTLDNPSVFFSPLCEDFHLGPHCDCLEQMLCRSVDLEIGRQVLCQIGCHWRVCPSAHPRDPKMVPRSRWPHRTEGKPQSPQPFLHFLLKQCSYGGFLFFF